MLTRAEESKGSDLGNDQFRWSSMKKIWDEVLLCVIDQLAQDSTKENKQTHKHVHSE